MSCHKALLSLLLFFGSVATNAQSPQDISGRWQGTFDIPMASGNTQSDTTFLILQQNGVQVMGGAGRNEQMQTPVSDGAFHNGTLTFSLPIRPGTTVKFELVLKDDHLRGTATGLPPDTTAKISVDVTRLPTLTVDNLLKEFMGSIFIVRQGKVLVDRSYGSANLEWQVANSAATKFRIASLTKQFTAASILLLAERGKLHLQDPISKYLDDPPATWKGITLFQVLTHTSGIVNIQELPSEQAGMMHGGTPTEIAKRFRDQPLVFTPGQRASYSSSGYILLGMVVEKVSGESYAGFLQKTSSIRSACTTAVWTMAWTSCLGLQRAIARKPGHCGMLSSSTCVYLTRRVRCTQPRIT